MVRLCMRGACGACDSYGLRTAFARHYRRAAPLITARSLCRAILLLTVLLDSISQLFLLVYRFRMRNRLQDHCNALMQRVHLVAYNTLHQGHRIDVACHAVSPSAVHIPSSIFSRKFTSERMSHCVFMWIFIASPLSRIDSTGVMTSGNQSYGHTHTKYVHHAYSRRFTSVCNTCTDKSD